MKGGSMEAAAEEAGVTYPRVVERLRANGLQLAEVGRITGVQLRQVQHWLAGSSRPAHDKQSRLLDLHYIVDQLGDVYSPEGVEIWLHGRNRALGGRRPIELLELGEFESVIQLVEALTHGAQG
jgi:uncharacterized protein (DUF2384 family)